MSARRLLKPGESRDLALVAGLFFLPLGLQLPYFPVWLGARGWSEGEIAAALAAPLVLRVVVTPLVARFADRRGLGLALLLCALAIACGYAFLAAVEGFAPVFFGALVVSLAMGSSPALCDALTVSAMRRAEVEGRTPVAYGHIRVWTSIGVLAVMLASPLLVRLFPGERIIHALLLLSMASLGAGALAFRRMNRVHTLVQERGGRLTADRARLRLAAMAIMAASFIQASHAQVYAFGTLEWRAAGLSAFAISLAWAIGVAAESALFIVAGRLFRSERASICLLLAGAFGASFRWIAMSFGPPGWAVILLQTLHALSYGATTIGGVLLLGALATPTHRARMQGWLSAASALSLAAATFAAGALTAAFGAGAYLAMAALALLGAGAALVAGVLRARLPPPPC
ncbi:MFS transporter [Methylocella sp.]|uniref:MFS transporter n=1 Tax=Methylocella sp. TaxID=1978226 RepID=UPI00378424BE